MVFFGDLNLDYKTSKTNPTPASMRADGRSRRVHLEARDQMAAMLIDAEAVISALVAGELTASVSEGLGRGG